ncbi:MAG: nucleotidyltransferase domain-containing protein [Candidatus Lokiarchaeota archaeon]
MSRNNILIEHQAFVPYNNERWKLLKKKRKDAKKVLKIFKKTNLVPYIYGSIARGDVHSNSDIDIILLQRIPSYKIEFLLNQNNIKNYSREIIMATPTDSIKLYIYLNELESITIPLTPFDKNSLEFYDFGGKISLSQLEQGIRVPGVDKRLVFIKPIKKGHNEISIINREHLIAKELNISLDTVEERKNVLIRRQKHGRTGVFLKRELAYEESPEGVLKHIANKNSIIRRKLFRI